MELESPNIHEFIMNRAGNSDPRDDLRPIGFNGHDLFEQVLINPMLTVLMYRAMIWEEDGDMVTATANYAMTWLTIGACLTEEKHARAAADNLPPLTDK